ncbi:hypothetical protein ABK040_002901 [Willaertia magna]
MSAEAINNEEDNLDWDNLEKPFQELEKNELFSYNPLRQLLKAIVKKVAIQSQRITSLEQNNEALESNKNLEDKINDLTKEFKDKNEKRATEHREEIEDTINNDEDVTKKISGKDEEVTNVLEKKDGIQLVKEKSSSDSQYSNNIEDIVKDEVKKQLKEQMKEFTDELVKNQPKKELKKEIIEKPKEIIKEVSKPIDEKQLKQLVKDIIKEQTIDQPVKEERKTRSPTSPFQQEIRNPIPQEFLNKVEELDKQLNDLKDLLKDVKTKQLHTDNTIKMYDDVFEQMEQKLHDLETTTSNTPKEKPKPIKSKVARTSIPSQNIKDLEIFSFANEPKTVQLYDPSSVEDNKTLQTVVLTLPKIGNISQFIDDDTDGNEKKRPQSVPNRKSKVSFVPAVVTDPLHRINVEINNESKAKEGLVDPFSYNVFDVSNETDRAHVSRLKGILLDKMDDITKELENMKRKERDTTDVNETLAAIKDQIKSIDDKLALVNKVNRDTPSPTVDSGFIDSNLKDGKNVKIFVTPTTTVPVPVDMSDTINELLGRIDALNTKILEAQERIDTLEKRSYMPESIGDAISENEVPIEEETKVIESTPIEVKPQTPLSNEDIMQHILNNPELVTNKDLKKLEKKIMYYINSHDITTDLNSKIQDIMNQLEKIEDELSQKCDQINTPNFQQFKDIEDMVLRKADRDELHSMIEKLKQINEKNIIQRPFSPQEERPKTDSNLDLNDIRKIKETINEMMSQVQQLFKMKADKIDVFKELSEKKEAIDRLDQTKSDANIVARKAEREYVDNIFNKLKKDMEIQITNTNNQTADLLAKDLDFIRRLIDEKADSDEFKKLKDYLFKIQKDDKDGEGLAGSSSFKCLSCNRSLKGMKLKPNNMNFDNFVTHLPPPKQKLYPRKQFLTDTLSRSSVTLPSSLLDSTKKVEMPTEDNESPPRSSTSKLSTLPEITRKSNSTM